MLKRCRHVAVYDIIFVNYDKPLLSKPLTFIIDISFKGLLVGIPSLRRPPPGKCQAFGQKKAEVSMKHEDIIKKMSLEEKASMLSGKELLGKHGLFRVRHPDDVLVRWPSRHPQTGCRR
jgi:hypothetical protein